MDTVDLPAPMLNRYFGTFPPTLKDSQYGKERQTDSNKKLSRTEQIR